MYIIFCLRNTCTMFSLLLLFVCLYLEAELWMMYRNEGDKEQRWITFANIKSKVSYNLPVHLSWIVYEWPFLFVFFIALQFFERGKNGARQNAWGSFWKKKLSIEWINQSRGRINWIYCWKKKLKKKEFSCFILHLTSFKCMHN